jgi:hypothetical protein
MRAGARPSSWKLPTAVIAPAGLFRLHAKPTALHPKADNFRKRVLNCEDTPRGASGQVPTATVRPISGGVACVLCLGSARGRRRAGRWDRP